MIGVVGGVIQSSVTGIDSSGDGDKLDVIDDKMDKAWSVRMADVVTWDKSIVCGRTIVSIGRKSKHDSFLIWWK